MQGTPDLGTSLWQQTAVPAPAVQSLEGHIKGEVVVIGAGITGLRAALELSRLGIGVHVLDSHEPGRGASGRSGGQINPTTHADPDAIVSQLGHEYGNRLLRAYLGSAEEVFDLVRREKLDCDAVQKGWLRTAHCDAAARGLEKDVAAWTRFGLDISLIDGSTLQALSGSSAYKIATLTPSGGCLHPLSYTRELARVAAREGATICGSSRVHSVRRHNDAWRVSTDTADIDCQWVLFCTNGYTDATLKGLRQTIIPLVSVQASTRRLSPAEYERFLPQGHTLSDTRRVIYYTRKDNRNRLLFGSLGRTENCSGASETRRLHEGLKTVFPDLCAEDIEYRWGGRIAHTVDLIPHLHEPDRGILAGLGYNGRGIGMATVMGRVLAERVAGKRPEELDIPTTPYKKYPFHWASDLGVAVVSRYMELRDQLDVRHG